MASATSAEDAADRRLAAPRCWHTDRPVRAGANAVTKYCVSETTRRPRPMPRFRLARFCPIAWLSEEGREGVAASWET